ncbi:MAG: LLM class flavin-dependent oxidoreductase [Hyphomicrobiaceae bacterium]
MRQLEFGWYLPTNGDTTSFSDADATVAPSPEMMERIILAAENAGFEYILIPVVNYCWEAIVVASYLSAKTRNIKPLIAAKPGYVNPVLFAKTMATLDQMTKGRLAINLIAGQAESDFKSDGIRYSKEQRYALMAEEVIIMKKLWQSDEPIDFNGTFHTLSQASIVPEIFQTPHPTFYLGGGSPEAAEVSVRHADVHLFWGDTPERIAANITQLKAKAARHGRGDKIGFGMRLQIMCRETEDAAWQAARKLIEHGSEANRQEILENTFNSAANRRVQELAREHGEMIGPNLWTGITKVRAGAGIAIVGNPKQCAAQLQAFIDVGCHSFCLSGFPHDEAATGFARLVRPILAEANRGRMPGDGRAPGCHPD